MVLHSYQTILYLIIVCLQTSKLVTQGRYQARLTLHRCLKALSWEGLPWSWPGLESLDRELRPAFLKRIKRQLLSDFEQNLKSWSRRSDSSMGSDGPRWKLGETEDENEDWYDATSRTHGH
jgi:hypothetical protein